MDSTIVARAEIIKLEDLESFKGTDMVDVNELKVDYSYQREPNQAKINNIVKNFSKYAVGIIMVSIRDNNDLYVIDGNHRRLAAQALKIPKLEAKIYIELTHAQEAALFVAFNRDRAMPKNIEIFKARVETGEEKANKIMNVLLTEGYDITNHTGGSHKRYQIAATGAIEHIYDRGEEDEIGGEFLLRYVLQIVSDVWEGQGKAITGDFLEGLGLFYAACHQFYDRKRLIKQLKMELIEMVFAEKATLAERNPERVEASFARSFMAIYNREAADKIPENVFIEYILNRRKRAGKQGGKRQSQFTQLALPL